MKRGCANEETRKKEEGSRKLEGGRRQGRRSDGGGRGAKVFAWYQFSRSYIVLKLASVKES